MKVPPLPVIKYAKVRYSTEYVPSRSSSSSGKEHEIVERINFEHVKTPACPMERVGMMSAS